MLGDSTERTAYDASLGLGSGAEWWASDPRVMNINAKNFGAFIDQGTSRPLLIVHYSSDTSRCANTANSNFCSDLIAEVSGWWVRQRVAHVPPPRLAAVPSVPTSTSTRPLNPPSVHW